MAIMVNSKVQKYKASLSAYVSEYVKHETSEKRDLVGWYHFIDNKDYNIVGVVATAEVLILLKEGDISVEFDCKDMISTIFAMQNEDGGWNYRSNITESATEPTACAIYALLLWKSELDQNQNECISRGIRWLLSYQNDNGLWGPINKTEQIGYCYFTCVSIRCLNKVKCLWPNLDYIEEIEQAITKGCNTIIRCFKDDDHQCGWGSTEKARPTIFHTAYVVDTLMQIATGYCKKYSIIKSLTHLRQAIFDCLDVIHIKNGYIQGKIEYYKNGSTRLAYTHSVDVYLLRALINNCDNLHDSDLQQGYNCLINYAINTYWRYDEFTTCWRMYDIVSFCNKYFEKLQDSEENTGMNIVDVLIMIATVEEEQAIIQHDSWEKRNLTDRLFYYETESNGVKFALARGFGLGETSTSQMAQLMINKVHPKVITMAGFCAGKQGKVNLGDIIVANKVYNYEVGKQLNENNIFPEISNYTLDLSWKQYIERYKFDFNTTEVKKPKNFEVQCLKLLESLYYCGEESISILRRENEYPDWSDVIGTLVKNGEIEICDESLVLLDIGRKRIATYKALYSEIKENESRVHICPIATGSRVMEWDKIFEILETKHDRKTGALDMESHAIGMIGETNEIKFLVVKGVGDFAKTGKAFANRYIEYASYMSYCFIKKLFTDSEFMPLWNK